MSQGNIATQRVDDATQLSRHVKLTDVATTLHLSLHPHGLAQGTVEVVVVDIIEYLVFPTKIVGNDVVLAQQIFTVVADCFVKLFLVVLIESVADYLLQSRSSGVSFAFFLTKDISCIEDCCQKYDNADNA